MTANMDFMQLCRLCLVQDEVNVPIFGELENQQDIFLKITACLPVMVERDDDLPKKICEGCGYKLDLLYQFYNTATSAEKQLLLWLNDMLETKAEVDLIVTPTELIIPKDEPITDVADSHNYLMQHQLPHNLDAPFVSERAVDDKITSESPAKRPRQSATKVAKPVIESDDNEDVDDPVYIVTKSEADSEIEEDCVDEVMEEINTDEPTFVNLSELEDASKPGPSGLATTQDISGYENETKTPIKFEFLDCGTPSNTNDLTQIQFKKNPSSTEKVVCKICQTYFTDWISLEHHQENCYNYVCGQTYTSNEALTAHTRTHETPSTYEKDILTCKHEHSGERSYECSECSKRLTTNLTKHESIYTSDKPFECSHCSKRFSQRGNLKRHTLTHTGEKPYECSYCSKSFTEQTHLQRHERTHTGEKPYECALCRKRFSDQRNLNHHKRIHTGEKPYQCSHCSKDFTTRNILTRHQRIHTGEKPYECLHCSKLFSQLSTLNRHKQIHTGKKAFECSHCSKRFTRQHYLNKHKRTHTGE